MFAVSDSIPDLVIAWPRTAFLIVHPAARAIHQRLVRLIARFANFVFTMQPTFPGQVANEGTDAAMNHVLDLEMAKSVISDLVLSNRLKTQEFSTLLGLLDSADDRIPSDATSARQAMISLSLPSEFKSIATKARAFLIGRMSNLVSEIEDIKAGGKRKFIEDRYDVVTMGVISPASTKKRCIACGGRTAGAQLDRPSEWESACDAVCPCGGLWRMQ